MRHLGFRGWNEIRKKYANSNSKLSGVRMTSGARIRAGAGLLSRQIPPNSLQNMPLPLWNLMVFELPGIPIMSNMTWRPPLSPTAGWGRITIMRLTWWFVAAIGWLSPILHDPLRGHSGPADGQR